MIWIANFVACLILVMILLLKLQLLINLHLFVIFINWLHQLYFQIKVMKCLAMNGEALKCFVNFQCLKFSDFQRIWSTSQQKFQAKISNKWKLAPWVVVWEGSFFTKLKSLLRLNWKSNTLTCVWTRLRFSNNLFASTWAALESALNSNRWISLRFACSFNP